MIRVEVDAEQYIAVEATNTNGEYAGAARIMRGLLAVLREAQELLADAYDGDTDLRTNHWFARVEKVGGWPRP